MSLRGSSLPAKSKLRDHILLGAFTLVSNLLVVFQALILKLKDTDPNPGVVISVLATIGELAQVSDGGLHMAISITFLCCVVSCCVLLCYAVCCVVSCRFVWYCVVLCCVVLYHVILCRVVLYSLAFKLPVGELIPVDK